MHPRLLYVLHDAADHHVALRVRETVHIELRRVLPRKKGRVEKRRVELVQLSLQIVAAHVQLRRVLPRKEGRVE